MLRKPPLGMRVRTGFNLFDSLFGGGFPTGETVCLTGDDPEGRDAVFHQLTQNMGKCCRVAAFDCGESATLRARLCSEGAGRVLREAATTYDVLAIHGLEELAAVSHEPIDARALAEIATTCRCLVIVSTASPLQAFEAGITVTVGCKVPEGENLGGREIGVMVEDRESGRVSFGFAPRHDGMWGDQIEVPFPGLRGIWVPAGADAYSRWLAASSREESPTGGKKRPSPGAEALVYQLQRDARFRLLDEGKGDSWNPLVALAEGRESFEQRLPFRRGLARDFFSLLLLDAPELVHVGGLERVSWRRHRRWYTRFHPVYLCGADEAAEMLAELYAACDSIAGAASALPPNERYGALFDWFAERVSYACSERPEDSTAYAALVGGRGNAEALVKAFVLLVRRAGLYCAPTIGTRDGAVHPWAVVSMDVGFPVRGEAFRHVDIAAAVKGGEGCDRASCYLLTDEEMFARVNPSSSFANAHREPCAPEPVARKVTANDALRLAEVPEEDYAREVLRLLKGEA